MIRERMDSPLGPLVLTAEGGALIALDWARDWALDWAEARDVASADGETSGREEECSADREVLAAARTQLAAYFAGRSAVFDLPLAPRGTVFQRRVWQALLTIPPGAVWTYGELARALGTAPRAVGQANGRNPIPLIIPCHRVVGGAGLGGYSGLGGLATKTWLIDHERRHFAAPPVQKAKDGVQEARDEKALTPA
jgi:methylated-DNA-[protein]-cysteine S-methyltransferase